MWRLFIEPLDVLLFRDGRPFQAGEDHRAASLFPPTPFTLQGAVRSKVLFDSGLSLADYAHRAPAAQPLAEGIGWPGEGYGRLRLRGPFVARRSGEGVARYLPLPADAVTVGEDDRKELRLLAPLSASPFAANWPGGVQFLWTRTTEAVTEARGWLAEEVFQRYCQGQVPLREDVIQERELVLREPRVGIALDFDKRRPREAHLYQMEFLRLREKVGFLLEVEGIECFTPERGVLALGGEGKAARYEVLGEVQPPSTTLLPQRFKLVLLTPAWFSDGWQPAGGNWAPFFGGSADVRLVAAALSRAQSLGGARVDDRPDRGRQGNFQKPMRRFVPAGSVFFFESDGNATYDGRPVTETPENEGSLGQIGFGQAAWGVWNPA